MWFWFKQPLVGEGALCDKPKLWLQRRPVLAHNFFCFFFFSFFYLFATVVGLLLGLLSVEKT